jgi:phosphoribosylformimino-5-aminoimidazole carboxamide ribotide isomerase
MRIIPVIDLMGGQVVRGVAGQRDLYRPIQSANCASSTPVDVATALAARFDFRELYLADLDAIAGRAPAWNTYQQLASAGLSLWVDAGVDTLLRARQLADWRPPLAGVIAGLESLAHLDLLAELVASVGAERLVFSLDLKHGRPLVRAPQLAELSARQIADRAIQCGVRRLIVLDLAQVGVGAGLSTLELCAALKREHPALEITTGGGVRHAQDLSRIADAGCDAALVASALHDGRLSPVDLAGM